jgi:hypothetical protein
MPFAHSLFIVALAAASLTAQPERTDLDQDTRLLLEEERRELLTNVEDAAWMQDHGRATLARLSIEQGWKKCAENEAAILAKTSEKPARLLAETALAACGDWEKLLRRALDNGAYPHLDDLVSKDDMVTRAGLVSRDSALARIFMWRGQSHGSGVDDDQRLFRREAGRQPPIDPLSREVAPIRSPSRSAEESTPAENPETAAMEEGDAQTIVVTGTRVGGCRVRLADRTLTERQLEANARQWAANGTPLRVVRPARADYHCLARIVWSLSKYGVRLFHFVEPSEAQ